MHELFALVLERKDLTKAGDLFSLDDSDIEDDLSDVLASIQGITIATDYLTNVNNQSVVEICITRVTSAIRETQSIDKHAPALVELLKACLTFDLKPTAKDTDSPHAKIASDLLSCVFLHYSRQAVMSQVIPVAVVYLHKKNKDLCRNVSSYLSLAAIDNSKILAKELPSIVESLINGNLALSRVMPQIYRENRGPVHSNLQHLIDLLNRADTTECNSLLQLFGLVAKDQPSLLEPHISQICKLFETQPKCSAMIIELLVTMSSFNAHCLVEEAARIRQTVNDNSALLEPCAKVIEAIGRTSQSEGKECVVFFMTQLGTAESHLIQMLLLEIKSIAELYPPVLKGHMDELYLIEEVCSVSSQMVIQQLKQIHHRSISMPSLPERRAAWSQTEGKVTVVTVGNPQGRTNGSTALKKESTEAQVDSLRKATPGGNLPESKNASTSTREITHPDLTLAAYDSLTNTNVAKNIIFQLNNNAALVSGQNASVAMTTSTITQTPHLVSSKNEQDTGHMKTYTNYSTNTSSNTTLNKESAGKIPEPSVAGNNTVNLRLEHPSTSESSPYDSSSSHPAHHPLRQQRKSYPPGRKYRPESGGGRPGLKAGNSGERSKSTGSQLEAYAAKPNSIPHRDPVLQFCEKHLSKIKSYIESVSAQLPIPIKATIEEVKHKRSCCLHFICFGQGQHCLYSHNFFIMRTKNANSWIHLIFLAIQARSETAISQQDPSIGNLKVCWDKCRSGSGNSFVRLVTSTFPSAREHEAMLHELNDARYFDIFDFHVDKHFWACFLCNHPERASGLLQDGDPVIEGQLKEKKGRWKFLKRWKTRYFTLSGAAITYSKKDMRGGSLPVDQIQSVKSVKKGMRDLPKAFEIFTNNNESYVFKVKDDKNAEQWVQCLQIAVARSNKTKLEIDASSTAPGWDFGPTTPPSGHQVETQTKL